MISLHVKLFKPGWRRLSRHVWSAALWPPFRCNGSHMKGEARVMLGEEQWSGLSNENKSRRALNGALPPVSLLSQCPVCEASCTGLPHVTRDTFVNFRLVWNGCIISVLFHCFLYVVISWAIVPYPQQFSKLSTHNSKQSAVPVYGYVCVFHLWPKSIWG